MPERRLNSILFLLTPRAKRNWRGWSRCWRERTAREDDTPLADVLPTVFQKYPVRYRDYTLRELCQEMHNLYVSFDVGDLAKSDVPQRSLPHVAIDPQDANSAFIRGDVELVRISEAGEGVLLPRALPYRQRAYCAWCRGDLGRRGAALFGAGRGINLLLVFIAELQGYIARPMPMNSTLVRICFSSVACRPDKGITPYPACN